MNSDEIAIKDATIDQLLEALDASNRIINEAMDYCLDAGREGFVGEDMMNRLHENDHLLGHQLFNPDECIVCMNADGRMCAPSIPLLPSSAPTASALSAGGLGIGGSINWRQSDECWNMKTLSESQVRQRIRDYIDREHGGNQAAAARAWGYSRGFVNQVVTGTRPPPNGVLRHIGIEHTYIVVKP